jgi:hypothetical protein
VKRLTFWINRHCFIQKWSHKTTYLGANNKIRSWSFRSSLRWLWRSMPSEMWHRVVW